MVHPEDMNVKTYNNGDIVQDDVSDQANYVSDERLHIQLSEFFSKQNNSIESK